MKLIEYTQGTKDKGDDSKNRGGNTSGGIAGAGEHVRNELGSVCAHQALDLVHDLFMNRLLLPEKTSDSNNNNEHRGKGKDRIVSQCGRETGSPVFLPFLIAQFEQVGEIRK